MKHCLNCMKEMNDDDRFCPHCGYQEGTPSAEPYYLTAGTVLNTRYIVGVPLGCGGFGITYIGWDTKLERTVAVKEYFPSDLVTRYRGASEPMAYSEESGELFQEGLKRFIYEAKSLAQFNRSEGIVHIYDCIQANCTGYIVMEYLHGKTVRQLLSEGKAYTYEEAEKIIVCVLDALKEVHGSGIIHRDIAPDNIFIADSGVWLLDFGAARYVTSSKSMSLSVILKQGYAPEEQYRTHGDQGTWTDVYGVGATFYRMITGVRPQMATDRFMADKLQRPSVLGVKIPSYKEDALMKSLSVRKEERFQTVEEFKEALFDEGTVLLSETMHESIPKVKPIVNQKNHTVVIPRPEVNQTPGTAQTVHSKVSPKKWLVPISAAVVVTAVAIVSFSFGKKNSQINNDGVVSTQGTAETASSSGAVSAPSPEPTEIPISEPTATPIPEPTATPIPEPTATPIPEPTATPIPEPTATPIPEPTATPIPEPTATPILEPTATPIPEPTATPIPEPTVTPTPELTATPTPAEPVNKFIWEYKLGEKKIKLKITNKTEVSPGKVELIRTDGEIDEAVWTADDTTKENFTDVPIEENVYYNIRIQDKETADFITFYNVKLSELSSVVLGGDKESSYFTGKKADGEKIGGKDYRVSVYETPVVKYSYGANVNVRDIADNKSTAVGNVALCEELQVYGTAKGFLDGSEADWYLIRMKSGYGFISKTMVTDDKAEADAKKESQKVKYIAPINNDNNYIDNNNYGNNNNYYYESTPSYDGGGGGSNDDDGWTQIN